MTNLGITEEDDPSEQVENPFGEISASINLKPEDDLQTIQQKALVDESQKKTEIDFKGFDNYAKFVEFEEKLFD